MPPRTIAAQDWDDVPALQTMRQSWDVRLSATLLNECPPELPHVVVSWVFRTNHLARSYEVDVYSEAWDRSLEIRGAYRPTDTAEVRAKHDAIFWFVSELLAASYGVPA